MRTPDDHPGVDDLVGRKAGLRDTVRARGTEFARVRARVSGAIVGHLVASDAWRGARTAMTYLAMRTEVDLDGLWDADPRPVLGVPRVEPATVSMTVHALDDPTADTEAGPFGVRSPRAGLASIEPSSIDLVLVPGVAFDISGNRLGRGGGYYDRFLALVADRNPDALFIGVCWSGCVVASVPVGPNDIRVRMLLTEHGLERCRG